MTTKRTWTFALLAVTLTVTLATSGLMAGKGKPKPPPPPPELPAVRYRISYPLLPADATGSMYINDINNSGVVVGLYHNTVNPTTALISFSETGEAFDLNALVDIVDIPTNAWLRSGAAINDWGVVVGALEYDTGEVVGFALDLGCEHPVVDLLPSFGSEFTYGWQINENGDILGRFTESDGSLSSYLFNPGLYNGDPDIRDARNGLSQDLSTSSTELLPAEVAYGGGNRLNNPVGDRPAQIVGTTADGTVFRYTTGATPDLQLVPELNVGGDVYLNDAGTFCGVNWGPKVKGSAQVDPFRYHQSVEFLPWSEFSFIGDINSSGDLMLEEHLYRDDWGGFVNINQIVTGTAADLAMWSSGGAVWLRAMNDRGGSADASEIVATLYDGTTQTLVILTPEPAP